MVLLWFLCLFCLIGDSGLIVFGQDSGGGTSSLDDIFSVGDSVPSGGGGVTGGSIVPRKTWQYDFDDADSPGDFPLRYWIRMQGDGESVGARFPLWNRTGYDPPAPDPGKNVPRVFQLKTLGGSIGIRLVDGVIPAIPLTDYLVRIETRTIDARRSRVVVVARFLDNHGKAIRESERRSQPILTDGEWQVVNVGLYGEFPDAAWIQIDLILAQPELWNPQERIGQEVVLEDVNARAEFDNLTVWRLPRVELSVSSSNVTVAPERPRIRYHLDDLAAGEQASVSLQLHNINGYLLDEKTFEIDQPSFDGVWEPVITALGWYRCVLTVRQGGHTISATGVDFAYVPEIVKRKKGSRFPVFTTIMNGYPATRTVGALGVILDGVSTDRVTVPIWDSFITRDHVKEARNRLEHIIEQAAGDHRSVDLMIDRIPSDFDNSSSGIRGGLFGEISDNDALSDTYLAEFLIAFGQRAERWLVGSPFRNQSFIMLGGFGKTLSGIDHRFENMVPNPVIELSFPGDYELPDLNGSMNGAGSSQVNGTALSSNKSTGSTGSRGSAVDHMFLVTVPSAVRPESVYEYVKRSVGRAAHSSFLIEPLDSSVYGRASAAYDLAKRVISAASAGAEELALEQPWREVGPIRPGPQPTHLYPVWRTLHDELAGRTARGELALGAGITAKIFSGANLDNGMLALWNDSPSEEAQLIRIYLGRGQVESVDVFGNRSLLPFDGEKHTIFIGRQPMFLEGVDVGLAVFRSGMKIEPDFIEAAAVRDMHQIVLTNPWSRTIQGSVRLLSPEDWRFQPRFMPFTIPPNGTASLPVDITIPIYAIAGDQVIRAEISLRTPQQYTINAVFPMNLGSKQIVIQPSYDIVPGKDGGNDLILTLEITNKSNDNADIQVFSVAPSVTGYPFQHADLPTLVPGQTVEQSFFYPKGGDTLTGLDLRVGYRGLDTTDRLNIKLRIN